MKKNMVFILFFFFCAIIGSGFADETVKIAVLDEYGAIDTINAWDKITDALSEAIDGYEFEAYVFSCREFIGVLAAGGYDFFYCDPGLYAKARVKLKVRKLLTFEKKYGNKYYAFSGSLIFTSNNMWLRDLSTLKGKRIAALCKDSLFGWIAVEEEMKKKKLIKSEKDVDVTFLGKNYRDIIEAVFSKRYAIGIVKSGILEDMASKGEVDIDSVNIINEKKDTPYPALLSTSVYPENVFGIMKDTDLGLAKEVANMLISLPDDILNGSWKLAEDYNPVLKIFFNKKYGSMLKVKKFKSPAELKNPIKKAVDMAISDANAIISEKVGKYEAIRKKD